MSPEVYNIPCLYDMIIMIYKNANTYKKWRDNPDGREGSKFPTKLPSQILSPNDRQLFLLTEEVNNMPCLPDIKLKPPNQDQQSCRYLPKIKR